MILYKINALFVVYNINIRFYSIKDIRNVKSRLVKDGIICIFRTGDWHAQRINLLFIKK